MEGDRTPGDGRREALRRVPAGLLLTPVSCLPVRRAGRRHRPPAAAAVPGIRAPVPARRSRQSPLHRVEDLFRHVALREERELDRCSRFPDDRDAIRGYFESRAGLARVVQDNEIEDLILQLLAAFATPSPPVSRANPTTT